MPWYNVQTPTGQVVLIQANSPAEAQQQAASAASAQPVGSSTGALAGAGIGGYSPAATFQTRNGTRTVGQMEAELRGVGYGGPWDAQSIVDAYQRTTQGSVGMLASGQNLEIEDRADENADEDRAALAVHNDWLRRTGDQRLAMEMATQAWSERNQERMLELQQAQLGLSSLQLGASLQSDPFRQQEALFGIGANPYLSRSVDALKGTWTAPTNAALTAGVNPRETLSSLAGRISGASGAGAGATGTPGNLAAAAAAFPASNKVVGREFLNMDPGTQKYALSGLSAKEGLDQDVILDRIKKGLPQFTAPSFASIRS